MADRIITLDNNFEVLYEDGLDGGGYEHLPDFINAVNTAGRTNYTNAVEWCAGFGVIGFDFLNRKVCDQMSFIDCYGLAIEWLTKTSNHNNVNDKTSFYLADKISLIPKEVKWDLLLANPPHCFDNSIKQMLEETLQQPQLDDVVRIICDVDLEIHREFFNNIRLHLLPGADLFLSEVSHLDELEQMASEVGLEIVTRYSATNLSNDSHSDARILHFREPAAKLIAVNEGV
jgi:methylase of polypeptide subunit release factors